MHQYIGSQNFLKLRQTYAVSLIVHNHPRLLAAAIRLSHESFIWSRKLIPERSLMKQKKNVNSPGSDNDHNDHNSDGEQPQRRACYITTLSWSPWACRRPPPSLQERQDNVFTTTRIVDVQFLRWPEISGKLYAFAEYHGRSFTVKREQSNRELIRPNIDP